MDSSGSGRNKQRHPERTEQQQPPPRRRRSQSDKSSPSEASQIQATVGSCSRSLGAEQPQGAPAAETPTRTPTMPSKTTGARGGVGSSFGPVVGLSVVVAVSMAGLLLGGRLWAVACVCAWLAAMSRLRRTAAGEVPVDFGH